jgi:hypothetical protein
MLMFKVQSVLRVLRTDALRACWFFTLYDGKGYPIHNPINCNQLSTYDNPKAPRPPMGLICGGAV